MKVHVVRDGDHIHRLSAEAGFRRHTTVWDHPDNAALRAARPNPDTLLPGDRVSLPDRETRVEEGETERRHRFVAAHARPLLRLRWLRFGRGPQKDMAVDLSPPGSPAAQRTDAHGDIAPSIDPLASRVTARTVRGEIALEVGSLHPFDTESGWLSRLHNLGYLEAPAAAVKDVDPVELAAAIEEFQCDHGLSIDGVASPALLAALRDAHGC